MMMYYNRVAVHCKIPDQLPDFGGLQLADLKNPTMRWFFIEVLCIYIMQFRETSNYIRSVLYLKWFPCTGVHSAAQNRPFHFFRFPQTLQDFLCMVPGVGCCYDSCHKHRQLPSTAKKFYPFCDSKTHGTPDELQYILYNVGGNKETLDDLILAYI